MMTPLDHARALDLTAAEPAFRPSPEEVLELAAHLRACADCARRAARLRTDLAGIGRVDPPISPRLHDRIREAAVTPTRTGPSATTLVLTFILLGAMVVGGSIGAAAFLGTSRRAPAPAMGPDLAPRTTDAVRWRTDVVSLTATDIWIDADGVSFRGAAGAEVTSDPGDPTRWTLEATWFEQGRQQRFFLDFAADDESWRIPQLRVYDGALLDPKWVTLKAQDAPIATARLGEVYEGDWGFEDIPSATGPVSIRMSGVRIAVRPQDNVNEPLVGQRIVLVENGNPATVGNPFEQGGKLRCSGILQLPPKAAETRLLAMGYSLSWRWETKTGPNTGFGEARLNAPDTGWITSTAVGSSGELIVFVANPANPFGGPPRDLPEDCVAGS